MTASAKSVDIYTDGACSGNPGPGGWAAILIYRGHEKEIFGAEPETTNNRMELLAAIRALECLKEPCCVNLYSDSSYLVDAFLKKWVHKWMRNGWRLSNNKDMAKNADLWQALMGLAQVHDIRFIKVAGHSDNINNNRCDKLATAAIEKQTKQQIEAD
ncbi:MAG: ribonuclease HI [Oscillospiraceae bacterium]|nr:ribonuclease HI [Oscillospiraceae bacterium]